MSLVYTTPAEVGGIKVSTSTKRSLGRLYIEEDGFWVFAPDNSNPGYWNESSLGTIIEKLKELNKPINEALSEEFKKQIWVFRNTCISIRPAHVR